jgi:ankyrin repeat protein
LSVVNAIAYAVMQLYLRSPETIDRRQRAAFEAVQQGDAVQLREWLRRGLDPNSADAEGRTLLESANDWGRSDVADLLRRAGARE